MLFFSKASYDVDLAAVIVNRDVKILFVSASDHRIFLWNLFFRVYYMDIKNILETKSLLFMEKFSLRNRRKFNFSYFSFLYHYCQFLCRTVWAWKQDSTNNVSTVLLVGILKEISREENPLNNYLSVQKDLFFDTYSKVKKFEVIFWVNRLY